jgi:hypothetical protein
VSWFWVLGSGFRDGWEFHPVGDEVVEGFFGLGVLPAFRAFIGGAPYDFFSAIDAEEDAFEV